LFLQLNEMVERLLQEGVAQVGFSHLHEALPQRYRHLPYGITLVYKLSDAVMDEVVSWQEPGPTFAYFQHYRAVNAFLDGRSLWVSAMLEQMGYRAMPVAASQSVRDMGEFSGIFPHKTAAVLAGLGWIGKSALFVSPQYGPRVRLATILTDCPLPKPSPGNPTGRGKAFGRM
jgi:epoxyqueuosine reductase